MRKKLAPGHFWEDDKDCKYVSRCHGWWCSPLGLSGLGCSFRAWLELKAVGSQISEAFRQSFQESVEYGPAEPVKRRTRKP